MACRGEKKNSSYRWVNNKNNCNKKSNFHSYGSERYMHDCLENGVSIQRLEAISCSQRRLCFFFLSRFSALECLGHFLILRILHFLFPFFAGRIFALISAEFQLLLDLPDVFSVHRRQFSHQFLNLCEVVL